MTVQIIEGSNIVRPVVTPLTSTILDHATVKENADQFGLRNDEGLWPSYNCLDIQVPTSICPVPDAPYKTFWTADWQPGFTFTVHGGVQCSKVGLDEPDMISEVGRVFKAAEGRGVERALLSTRFVENTGSRAMTADKGAPGDDAVKWDAPVDLTPPGGVATVLIALALLEGYAATVYTGIPTIHAPRAAATILSAQGLVEWKGNKAFTKNGSRLAIGGGYDQMLGDGETPDGTWDLYATGEVYVEKGGQVDINTFVLPGDGSGLGSDENGLAPNTAIALVERSYRVAVDCFVAKASGKVY